MNRRTLLRVPRQDHSAGGVVVRGETVLLISTQGGSRWQLPKGHLEEGETAEQAAVREVFEETGVRGRVIARLPAIDYSFSDRGRRRIDKHVEYFLLDYDSGEVGNFDPREVCDAAWFAWGEAILRLTFDNERRVMTAAHALAGPAPVREERR